MRRVLLALTLLALVVPVSAGQGVGGSPKARQLLERAIRAAGKSRYTGRRVVEVRRGPSMERHEEYVTRDGFRTRIEFPASSPQAGQVIVEDRRERRHYMPDRNEILVLPPRFGDVSRRLVRMIKGPNANQLVLGLGPADTVAGLRTDQVTISDRAGNITQRLFIHSASGLLLQRRLYDEVGTQVGFFEYTQIDLTPRIPEDAFVIKRKGAKIITPMVNLRRLARENGFQTAWLPPATKFRLESASLRRMPGGEALAQSYQGPQGRLTLYQLKGPVDPQRMRRHSRGRARAHVWQRNGRTFVLIGSLDEAVLRALAGRLRDAR